jgi:hypothetical protein
MAMRSARENELYEASGSLYFAARLMYCSANGVAWRRVGRWPADRPMAATADHLLIGGDCPTALELHPSNRRRIIAAAKRMVAAGYGSVREAAEWAKISEYEVRW